jgi:hypothetical protein
MVYFDGQFFLLIDINKVMFWLYFLSFRSQNIVFGIMTDSELVDPGFVSHHGQKIYVLQKCPDWLWGPNLLLLQWYKGLSSWGMKLTTELYKVLTLRMIWHISAPLDVFMVCTVGSLPVYCVVLYQLYDVKIVSFCRFLFSLVVIDRHGARYVLIVAYY